jgi:hypothetical protein
MTTSTARHAIGRGVAQITGLLVGGAVVCLLAAGLSAPCLAQHTIKAAPPAALMSHDQIGAYHLDFFPDGSMFPITIGSKMLYFAANGGPYSSRTAGSIGLAPKVATPNDPGWDVQNLAPIWLDGTHTAIPSLRPGAQQPSPDGSLFDYDYAAGGPMYWDATTSSLIQIYHGEYDFHNNPADFYTSLGMAVSSDMGRTFRKLGLAIQPALPPSLGVPVPSSSGSLVQIGDYLYLYYSDISADGSCDGIDTGRTPCVALARSPVTEVALAAEAGRAAEWTKFYRGSFSQSGIGGKFSPLFTTPANVWPRWPMVAFDDYTKSYFMAYEAGTFGLALRESANGMDWGPAEFIVRAAPGEYINYPSIIGIDGQPNSPGQTFVVAYLSSTSDDECRTLMGVRVSVL